MKFIRAISIVVLLAFAGSMYANNLTISNVMLTGQNTASDFTLINFDITWANSWRTSVGPSNWDAAWVFAKFRKKTQTTWNHCTLHWVNGTGAADGHTIPAASTISSSNDNGAGGAYGAFIYSNADIAQGTVNFTGAKLRWDYGTDAVADADSVEICVFAIEMVYVPSANFYAGDGNLTIIGQFEAGISGTPFQITSEGALTLGGGGGGSMGNNNAAGMTGGADDFNDATPQTLPAAYPKGYNDFYIMKYEMTQEQYVEYLNKLTRTQQTTRCNATTVNNSMSGAAPGSAAPVGRNGVTLISDPGGISPRVYGCDLNDDATAGGAADGQNIACNYLSYADINAYLDWTGLRPMTELEYEKACRGTNAAVAGEYAWGSTAIVGAAAITGGTTGASNETSSTAGANCVYNNAGAIPGPMRVGNFAQAATNQVQAGAGYYGIMELTGNTFEIMISVGSVAGRSFTGLHGNGVLNTAGDADVNYWPGINGNGNPAVANTTYGGVTGCTQDAGFGFTGSSWNDAGWLTVSGRAYRGDWNNGVARDGRSGLRGVRTAP